MAILYVAKDGNDANNGSTWALAKLTMGGAHSAASANDTIYVAAGRYSETVTMSKSLRWIAVGQVIDDNSVGGLAYGFNCGGSDQLLIQGFIFSGFTNSGIYTYRVSNIVNCECCNNASHGLLVGDYFQGNVLGCKMHHNGLDGVYVQYASSGIVINSVLALNGRYGLNGLTSSQKGLYNCVLFGNAVAQVYQVNVTGLSSPLYDYNHYDTGGAVGAVIAKIGAVTYATLALYQAALSLGAESHSSTGATEVNDAAKYLYHTLPSSTQLLGTGLSGQSKGLAVAYGMSENLNLAKITGGVFSDVEWDAVNKRLQLVAPATSGYWRSDVIDLGCVRAFFGVGNIYATMAPPTDVVDYDVAEADPRTWTYRYRIDNAIFDKADVAPAWVEAIIMDPLVGITGRYVQVELTLRTDGV